MLKKFFISVLGTITGVWISMGLLFFLLIMFAVMAGINEGSEKKEIKNNSILYLKLSGAINERTQTNPLLTEIMGKDETPLALNTVVAAIRTAAEDSKIEGLYIDAAGSFAGVSTLMEIRDAISDFKKEGKWVIAYGDSYTQGDYYLSSLADSLYVNPMGGVDIHGLSANTLMFKGLLDKLGVEMQIVKVGTYKSAVEPFILNEISSANELQQKKFLFSIWNNITKEIADSRNVTAETVNLWADSILVTVDPEKYPAMKVASNTVYRHEVESLLRELTGLDSDERLRLVTPDEYASSGTLLHYKETGSKIAVLLAEGDIVDEGNKGIVGPKMVSEIQKLIDDDDIEALILRVNSPGGSAFASEQIWEALQRFKETDRPFYVSMGDYAASGGYYISCGADKIFADPVTLTGSIGIFGMIPNLNGLMKDKLGLNQSIVKTNPSADFVSITTPMSPVEKAALQRSVNRGYETFVSRVASGRGMSVDSVKVIAEGRVWTGEDALAIGLVDELGGLEAAIRAMAEELGTDDYCIVEYPNNKLSFREMLEELNYGSFVEILARKTMTPLERDAADRIGQISRWNRIQARMPESVIE